MPNRSPFAAFPVLPGMALLLGLAPQLHAAAPEEPVAALLPIGEFGAYRIDGLRDGTFEGQPVRLLDLTLVNRSADTTFPGTIVEVWWQGKSTGAEVVARHRDLTSRGKFEYIKPGQSWAATYVIPVRADIAGITIEFPRGKGQPKRKLSWGELAGLAQTAR